MLSSTWNQPPGTFTITNAIATNAAALATTATTMNTTATSFVNTTTIAVTTTGTTTTAAAGTSYWCPVLFTIAYKYCNGRSYYYCSC